uniref:AIR9-like A9 domain-containing protein n=1 Tax=Chenopodium quinoa TaxID=63459 RepID=A0A803M4F5_CHEQI
MSTDNRTTNSIRHDIGNSASRDLKGDGSLKTSEEQKNPLLKINEQELFGQSRTQEHEIFSLREKITQAYIKEMQMLNEKYALERKFSDLRMAMDEKQKESITAALNELAVRKADLDENVRLTNDLKDAEEQRYYFMTSLLGLLAEFGTRPSVTNASSICMNLKHLYDQLHQKLQGKTRELRNLTQDPYYEIGSQPSNLHVGSPYQQMKEESSLSSRAEEYLPATNRAWPDEQTGHSLIYDEGPGIEGFQIIGEAKLGAKLLGCGYPVRGTSLCMFQWVRHLQDGTRHYIEGATNPEYVVTADDVDKCIAVECIPMDENGRQGELVRRFANDQNKITCDPDMQAEIDSYINKGQADFGVLVLLDSFNHWEPATFILRRSGFQVKINKTGALQIADEFSDNLSLLTQEQPPQLPALENVYAVPLSHFLREIKIPGGLSTQFVLTCSDVTSHPLSTYNDIRMRDTLVLTIRMFQNKL